MEVHFAPDVEARLQQVAQANGKDAEQLVQDTVACKLERPAPFVAGVNKGVAQAAADQFQAAKLRKTSPTIRKATKAP